MPLILEHELWYQWATISIRESLASQDAQMRRENATSGAEESAAFGESIDRGLISVCSAAFSVEALSRRFAVMAVDAEIRAAWRRNHANASAVLREVLKRSVTLPNNAVGTLVDEFAPVIDKRGRAVHYTTAPESPVELADGSFSTSAVRDFGPLGAHDAVAAMRALYVAIVDHPAPPVRAYVSSQEQSLRYLCGNALPARASDVSQALRNSE